MADASLKEEYFDLQFHEGYCDTKRSWVQIIFETQCGFHSQIFPKPQEDYAFLTLENWSKKSMTTFEARQVVIHECRPMLLLVRSSPAVSRQVARHVWGQTRQSVQSSGTQVCHGMARDKWTYSTDQTNRDSQHRMGLKRAWTHEQNGWKEPPVRLTKAPQCPQCSDTSWNFQGLSLTFHKQKEMRFWAMKLSLSSPWTLELL